jgi:hypothetical protein
MNPSKPSALGPRPQPKRRGRLHLSSEVCRICQRCRQILTLRRTRGACGERFWIKNTSIFEIGSSPRVRGTRGSAPRHHGGRRFIPARAGNALRVSVCAKEGFTMSKSAPTFRIRSFWKRGGSSQGRHRRETHQPKSIEIDWDAPVFPASLENEAGIVRRRPGDDGISFPDRALHLLPIVEAILDGRQPAVRRQRL